MICSVAIFAAAVATAAPSPIPTPQALARITLHAPNAALRVQVASTEKERERGLMGVTHLPPHTGMLFVFETDAPVAFWMKDTLVPLDMVFVGTNGIVRRVFRNVAVAPLSMPDDRIPLEQGRARYVIELPAGEAAGDGLVSGATVEGLPHP